MRTLLEAFFKLFLSTNSLNPCFISSSVHFTTNSLFRRPPYNPERTTKQGKKANNKHHQSLPHFPHPESYIHCFPPPRKRRRKILLHYFDLRQITTGSSSSPEILTFSFYTSHALPLGFCGMQQALRKPHMRECASIGLYLKIGRKANYCL